MANNSSPNYEACTRPSDPFSDGVFYSEQPLSHALPLFLLQIVIMVFTSYAIYFFLRRYNQPRVVSDIISGALLGPTLPYVVTRVLTFFHYLFGLGGAAPDYEHIRQRYLGTVFRAEGLSLMRTAASFGIQMHFFFVCVKMKPGHLKRCGKKAFAIAISSVVVPYLLLNELKKVFKIQDDSMIEGIGYYTCLDYINMITSISSFPVVGSILAELRLLNTELGRLTMSASMIADLGSSFYIVVYTIVTVSRNLSMGVLEAASKMVGYVILVAFLFFVFQPWIRWIVRRTPKGGRVWEGHVIMVILAVIAMGAFSDSYLSSHWEASVYLGLLVPDGPPLGTALIERGEFIPAELLIPLTYLIAGRWIDFTTFTDPKMSVALLLYMFAGYTVKTLSAMVPAIYFNMPIRNAALMGLMLNFTGLVQIANYMGLADAYSGTPIMNQQAYAALIVSGVCITAISSSLVAIFYDPLSSDHVMGCRTVQHLMPQAELRLVAPVLNEEPVPHILNLLEASSADEQTPICVYVLHLVELMGRATSTIIAHKNRKGQLDAHQMDRLHNVFINYEQTKKGIVAVQPFTAVSPYKSMQHDICSLSVEKNVHFVVVPYPRKELGANAELYQATRSIISNVLTQAPCSVGILVHHALAGFGQIVPGQFQYHVKILFWGGADDREALSCGARMALHAGVSVDVTRVLPPTERNRDKDVICDEELLREFQINNADNERVAIEEVVVSNVEETIGLIKSIDKAYDLVLVGRRQGSSSWLGEVMDEWIESPELGMVGDMLASSEFTDSCFSVLVVQQYV
ncbi:unnamed protein product [Musa acuminata var. zebrina]